MSQHDYDLANAAGASFRADTNSALLAIVSQNSGASAPATTFVYQLWADTTTGLLKIRNAANTAWITIGDMAEANLGLQLYDADTAKLDVAQVFSASQKAAVITDNDLSFDLSGAGNDYSSTPTGAGTMAFTNIAGNTGKSGHIKFVNGSAYAIAKGSNIKCSTSLFTTISATGTYLIGYWCDGTDVYLTTAGAAS